MAETLNLSRSSPFGNLGMISSRRTYAYLIATLNASHPDYDFSNMLRPRDFKCEKSLRKVMNNLDTALYNLRPASAYLPTTTTQTLTAPSNPNNWGPGMWRLIDQQMGLKECAIYRYSPEDFDPFEDDEAGALWSINYFFFNKARKRVCYLYVRGVSVLADQALDTPSRTPIKSKRTIDDEDGLLWDDNDVGGNKRAKYWLGSRDNLEVAARDQAATSTEETLSPPMRPLVDDNDNYLLSDEETRSFRSASKSTMREASEEIVGSMEV